MSNLPRTIVLLHGRNYKPAKATLLALWTEAMRHGMQRDRPDAVAAFDAATIDMAYYADLSAVWLNAHRAQRGKPPKPYNEAADVADRQKSIARLKTLATGDFSRSFYARMRGKAGWYEGLADAMEYPLRLLNLDEWSVQKYAPELAEYWADVHFGSDLRLACTRAIQRAMEQPGEVAIVSHSLGTMIAYDIAWKLSHYGEYRREPWNRMIDLFVTLGGPLGNGTIRNRLKGATAPASFRYPTNIRRWENFAAEDDIIAHDQDLANDFANMPRPPVDHRIFNPAVRREKVNPHYGAGYLMNPVFINMLADWLVGE